MTKGASTTLAATTRPSLQRSRRPKTTERSDQTMESFVRGHLEAFAYYGGVPRAVLYLDRCQD
jgi:hypothetical protein